MTPPTAFDWKRQLKVLNSLLLAVIADELDEPHYEYLAERPDPRWLGGKPATARAIASMEERLGITLPDAYRAFFQASDGWVRADGFPHRLAELLDTPRVFWLGTDNRRDLAQFRELMRGLSHLFEPPLASDDDPLDRVLCIGDFDGNECILYIVCDRTDDWPVVLWDPEDGARHRVSLVEVFRGELDYRLREAAG